MRRHRLAAVVAILFLFTALPAAADPAPRPDWIGLKAPNFYVIGDVGARDLREVVRRLEQFREAIGVMFPKAILTTSTPTTVVVFKSQKSYEPVKPLYNGKVRQDIAGYFQPGRSLNYVTFTTAEGLDALDIVYHEYVHLIVNNNVPHVPLWFNEGLAEYYRTFTITANGKQAALGKVQSNHVYLLREHFLPLADLVRVDHASPLYNESARNSIFYAESWALVHYLLLGNEQKYASHAGPLLVDLSGGMPFEAACQRELGLTVDALQKQLHNYLQHEGFTMVSVRFTERIGRIDDLPVTPVSEAEVHATLGDVLFNMQRPVEAKAELERAVALDASYAPAHTSLGLVAVRANEWDEARKQLETGAGLPSATYISEYEYAYALAQAGPSLDAEDARKVDAALRRAIQLNPSFPEAYALLARRLGQTREGADEGLTLIARAIELAPGREDYSLRAAHLLATKQDFTRARALLEQILRNGTDANVHIEAQQMLDSITDFERRKAAVEAYEAARRAQAGGAPAGPSSDAASPAFNAPKFVPVLRKTNPGETRMFGTLTAIDCGRGAVALVVKTKDGVTIRAHAVKFEEIDFISYREDLRGQVQCGARTPADPVLVTFRPDTGSTSTGTAVAVEFVPLDYTP